jgi:hypothetical protein
LPKCLLIDAVLLIGSGISRNGYSPTTEFADILQNSTEFSTALDCLVDNPASTVDQADTPVVCGKSTQHNLYLRLFIWVEFLLLNI